MKPTLQISLPVTSRGDYAPERLFGVFASSFTRTVSRLMNYRIYLGIDADDPRRDEFVKMRTRLAEITDSAVNVIVLQDRAHKICSIWETLAACGYRDECDCYLMAGDDLEFITPAWDIELSRPLLERGYGVEAFTDLAFREFPTFFVLHRGHFDCYGRLFPEAFKDANQSGDPFLFTLYAAVGAARLRSEVHCRNTIGGCYPARYVKTLPEAFQMATEVERLKGWIGLSKAK